MNYHGENIESDDPLTRAGSPLLPAFMPAAYLSRIILRVNTDGEPAPSGELTSIR